AALATALSPRSASASISSPLCTTTTQAAMTFAAGQAVGAAVSASTTALAQEVLRSMLLNKLRFVTLTLLFLGAVATGAGFLTRSRARKDDPQAGATAVPQLQRVVKSAAAKPDAPALERMVVVGRVLDPAGKPVRGVLVDVIGRPRRLLAGSNEKLFAGPVLL